MKTLEQTIKSQRAAQTFWTWFLILSCAMILLPFLPLPLETEIGFSAAFIGIVFFIVAVVVLVMYIKRKKAAEHLGHPENRIAEWLVPDRYQENGGRLVTALFSKAGIFYGGQIYPAESYECRIEKAQLTADKGGGILEIEYSAAARYGRRKHYLNIPIPSGGEAEAQKLAEFYTH